MSTQKYLTERNGSDNWNLRVNNINSNLNTNLTLDASGSSSMIFNTNGTQRLAINSSGAWTVQGGMSYNNATNTLTASTFSGTVTNINTINTTTNASYYPAFVSATSGSNEIRADADLTYNPSTNILSTPIVNVTSTYQKSGTNIVSMNSGSISFFVSGSTTPTSYIITMPSGCDCFNLISWTPVAAINNFLTIYDWSVGPWSGVLNSNQIRITAALGNSVHLENFSIAFYWRI